MKLFCAGFNLFGQFPSITEKCVESFTKINYANLIDIQIGHSYSILKTMENIFLHGFAKNKFCQIKKLSFDVDIIQISVSDTKALFLSKEGNIFSLVNNLETADYDLCLVPNFVNTEYNEEKNNDDIIIKIASGVCLNTAYSRKGFVYNIPSNVNSQILNIKDICTGREHCLILSEDGIVYSYGGGSRGQLGHGDLEDKSTPYQMQSLAGIKITKICCGSWHSVALSAEGDLYTWGWNSNGQLGLQTNKTETCNTVSVMASPQVIELDVNVVDVSCGSRHTVVFLENSKLFGCGWNKYCQLGFRKEEENLYGMQFLHDFSGMNVTGMRCGTWNTVILVSDE